MKALIPATQLQAIPHLSNEFSKDSLIYAHIFGATYDYWVMGYDPEDRTLFGFAKLSSCPDGAEFGYQSLTELEETNESLKSKGKYLLLLENETSWQPVPFNSIDTK